MEEEKEQLLFDREIEYDFLRKAEWGKIIIYFATGIAAFFIISIIITHSLLSLWWFLPLILIYGIAKYLNLSIEGSNLIIQEINRQLEKFD